MRGLLRWIKSEIHLCVNIGRYWKVGPQQTLYIPGVWLKKGENKIVIFEQLNETPQTEVKTVKTPVLMKLKG